MAPAVEVTLIARRYAISPWKEKYKSKIIFMKSKFFNQNPVKIDENRCLQIKFS